MQAYRFAKVSCTFNFAAFRLLYFLNCIVLVQCHADSRLQHFLFAGAKQRPSKILASKSTMEVREPRYTVVLDWNGFLVHRSFDKGHISIARPDCGNFLKALLNKANVVIWSCAIRKNVDSMLEVVVGSSGVDLSNVVVMSQFDVTMSTYSRGGEMAGKKYMLKELKKVQSALEHVHLAMTFLIDNSPEKNLLNNEFSAIHHLSWTCDLMDKFLTRLSTCPSVRVSWTGLSSVRLVLGLPQGKLGVTLAYVADTSHSRWAPPKHEHAPRLTRRRL